MNEFLIVLIIIFWGWASSYFAQQRGRNPYAWFFWGFLFGPFALVALFLMKDYSMKTPPETNLPEITGISISPHSPFDHMDWYYLDHHRETIGPINFQELKKLWKEGVLKEDSYVWNDTFPEWKKIAALSELKTALNQDNLPK